MAGRRGPGLEEAPVAQPTNVPTLVVPAPQQPRRAGPQQPPPTPAAHSAMPPSRRQCRRTARAWSGPLDQRLPHRLGAADAKTSRSTPSTPPRRRRRTASTAAHVTTMSDGARPYHHAPQSAPTRPIHLPAMPTPVLDERRRRQPLPPPQHQIRAGEGRIRPLVSLIWCPKPPPPQSPCPQQSKARNDGEQQPPTSRHRAARSTSAPPRAANRRRPTPPPPRIHRATPWPPSAAPHGEARTPG
jgi:hypothetical protein